MSKYKVPSLLICFIFLTFLYSFARNTADESQVVLKSGRLNKVFVFDKSDQSYFNRLEITYLGKVRTKERKVFKILISKWYWGYSPRATSHILVYNYKNEYVGNYYVTMTYDLPKKIEKNALVFINKDRETCDPKMITKISFNNGLPKRFFVPCKGKWGDIYEFKNIP